MKKVLVALSLLVATSIASAADVGVLWDWGHGTNGGDRQAAGVSLGDHFDADANTALGKTWVQGTAERSTSGQLNVNRYTAKVGYDVVKFYNITTNVHAGVAYLDPQSATLGNGTAGLVGFGFAYPVTEKVSLTADYDYQKGNGNSQPFNGNIITTGVKYSF